MPFCRYHQIKNTVQGVEDFSNGELFYIVTFLICFVPTTVEQVLQKRFIGTWQTRGVTFGLENRKKSNQITTKISLIFISSTYITYITHLVHAL
jgi:type II secretory pathway component PulK